MKYKGIVFDLDGTIVDTECIWKKVTKRLIESYGISYTEELACEVTRRISGLAICESTLVIKDICKISDSASNLVKRKLAIAMEIYKEGISFITGFEDFCQRLCDLNIPRAIATNADDNTIKATERAIDLRRFFGEHIYGVSSVKFLCKPDPAVYRHAASKLDLDPAHCMAVEDSVFGVSAAKKAGMFCVGINSAGDKERLKEADVIVENYNDKGLSKIVGF